MDAAEKAMILDALEVLICEVEGAMNPCGIDDLTESNPPCHIPPVPRRYRVAMEKIAAGSDILQACAHLHSNPWTGVQELRRIVKDILPDKTDLAAYMEDPTRYLTGAR